MMEEEKKVNAASEKPVFQKKPASGLTIVGVNLLILFTYSVLIKFVDGLSGLIINALILFLHVVFCLGMALDRKSWVWLLSALLVVTIGFSTCVYLGNTIAIPVHR